MWTCSLCIRVFLPFLLAFHSWIFHSACSGLPSLTLCFLQGWEGRCTGCSVTSSAPLIRTGKACAPALPDPLGSVQISVCPPALCDTHLHVLVESASKTWGKMLAWPFLSLHCCALPKGQPLGQMSAVWPSHPHPFPHQSSKLLVTGSIGANIIWRGEIPHFALLGLAWPWRVMTDQDPQALELHRAVVSPNLTWLLQKPPGFG